jgi:hypothetical protein
MIKRYFLLALVAALCISALGGIYIFIFGRFQDTEMRVMGTTLSLAVFSLTGLSCSVWLERNKLLLLAYAGIALSALSWLLAVLLIWEVVGHSSKTIEQLSKAEVSGVVLSVAFAYSSLLLLLRSHSSLVDNIIYSTLGCLSVISIMLIGLTWFEWQVRDQFWRALGVFAILTVLGTLLAPIVWRIQSVAGAGSKT